MNEFNARVEHRSALSEHVTALTLRPTDPVEFEPGQYVAVVLPGTGEEQVRYYSIANQPREDGCFELCIADAGDASSLLCQLDPGTTLTVRGPGGKFLLQESTDRAALFIGSGTGISPLRAMLQRLASTGAPQPMTLLLGARSESDILYRDEFDHLTRSLESFRFAPTLTNPPEEWTGLTGRVQAHLADFLSEATAAGANVYVCGHQELVGEVQSQLEGLGHDPERIHFERY